MGLWQGRQKGSTLVQGMAAFINLGIKTGSEPSATCTAEVVCEIKERMMEECSRGGSGQDANTSVPVARFV